MLKMKHPQFPMTLPLSQKKITIRPFTVKEEKMLLMAQEEGTTESILTSTKQILTNCVQTDGFNIAHLAMVDLEWLFLQLRSKSVNNIIELSVTDDEDEKRYDFEVDIADIKMDVAKEHNKKIMLSDTTGVVMRYPTLATIESISNVNADNPLDVIFYLYAACIEKVFDGELVQIAGDDFSLDEAKDFLESMSSDSFNKFETFFETAPSLKYTIKYKNSLGKEKSVVLKGLDSFFP